MQSQATLDRNERALTLVTMSELAPLRLVAATTDLPAGAHATYRSRAGSNLAVLTAEGLTSPSIATTYQAWVREGDQWTSLGTFDFVNIVEAPDAATIAKVSVTLGARGSAKLESYELIEIDTLLERLNQ